MEKNERPQNGAETWEWDVFENRLESVRDFKFCYECFGSVGEKGPVIFPVFTAGTTVSRHAARRCGELLIVCLLLPSTSTAKEAPELPMDITLLATDSVTGGRLFSRV
jgi:hypothetical protein